MYCPNCGVKIHLEGSYCAKCRKDIAYLTQKSEFSPSTSEPPIGNDSAAPIPSENESMSETPLHTDVETQLDPPPPSAPSKESGYFCNFCGTFVYPPDNYCYDCGKKTRKQYYQSKKKKNLFLGIGIALLAFMVGAVGYYLAY